MRTLMYTCIYSNLWGTEFGGRISREFHYKYSLLNILNLNASKYICFTSPEEIDKLKHFFYVQNNVSEEKLNIRAFDLKNTKYFEEIRKLKNIDEIKKMDRCYEVQYNKFMWIDILEDIASYNRVFWIDAGLSHSGIISSKYNSGDSNVYFDEHFKFGIFNENLLNKFCNLSENKVLVLSKNNTGKFFWSTPIPQKYYNNYCENEHIIGGLFGGTPENLTKFKNEFENLLLNLLQNENILYFEELLMSCIYFNSPWLFTSLKFDDWYKRDSHNGEEVRLFEHMLL